jgi:hypothetical protein
MAGMLEYSDAPHVEGTEFIDQKIGRKSLDEVQAFERSFVRPSEHS